MAVARYRSALLLAILVAGVGSATEPPAFPDGKRTLVPIEELKKLHDSPGFLGRFAQEHEPFWNLSDADAAACEKLLAQSQSAGMLKAPLKNYHLQFAGVTSHGKAKILVHGFCPQGPATLSYTQFGGALTFAPFHTGRCYFESYCSLKDGSATSFHFGTPGR
jgi:hypothetical protein